MSIFDIERRVAPRFGGESLSLSLSLSSIWSGEKPLLYQEERLSPSYTYRRERERETPFSVLYIETRETPSRSRGESVPLPPRKERETPLYIEEKERERERETLSSVYRRRLSPLNVD